MKATDNLCTTRKRNLLCPASHIDTVLFRPPQLRFPLRTMAVAHVWVGGRPLWLPARLILSATSMPPGQLRDLIALYSDSGGPTLPEAISKRTHAHG